MILITKVFLGLWNAKLLKRLLALFMCLLIANVAYSQAFTQKQTQILHQVLAANGYINKKLHKEFWDEAPLINKDDWNPLQNWLISQTAIQQEYQKELWESTLISFNSGKVVKTRRLIELEDELDRLINEKAPYPKGTSEYNAFSKSANEQMKISKENARRLLQAAANKTPLTSVQGETVVIDEALIKTVLVQLNSSFSRLRILLNLKWSGPDENQLTTYIKLRSTYKELSVSQAQAVENFSITEKLEHAFSGYSTVNHNYEQKNKNENKVIIDHTTGLMWHQSGTDKSMSWGKARQWVKGLNSRGYADCHDWRLPTLEEAASLLEPIDSEGDLYFINSFFDKKQLVIWTGDNYGIDGMWCVFFYGGGIDCRSSDSICFVRPVRSLK